VTWHRHLETWSTTCLSITSYLLDFCFYFSQLAKLAYLENLCHFGLDDKSSLQGDYFPQLQLNWKISSEVEVTFCKEGKKHEPELKPFKLGCVHEW
jgi:hypothetical protein